MTELSVMAQLPSLLTGEKLNGLCTVLEFYCKFIIRESVFIGKIAEWQETRKIPSN
jgi:hypothetical protein